MLKRVQASTFVRWVPLAATVIVGALVAYANWTDLKRPRDSAPMPAGVPGGMTTGRTDLARAAADLEARLKENPLDAGAAVAFADVLLRQTRVTGDVALGVRAEQALTRVLNADPQAYDARRMLGAVYLNLHRFREAVDEATRSKSARPADPWNEGVIGDGLLELGEYDDAFAAFDRMAAVRPGPAAYARVAYARELKGDLAAALAAMTMAAGAVSAHDAESQAWHAAQIGDIYFQMGRLDEARREFERANFIFPGHPAAAAGIATVRAARGDFEDALAIYLRQYNEQPTPETAAHIGDIHTRLGRTDEAERFYARAEAGWQTQFPEPALLARFLADRDRRLEDAVRLAEQAVKIRRDIFTEDALAWAYFKAGRLAEAQQAMQRARRTGSRDRRLLYHAAAIAAAMGDTAGARRLVDDAVRDFEAFDPIIGPKAVALREALRGGPVTHMASR